MKNRFVLLSLSLAFAGSYLAAAQDASTPQTMPKVLEVVREYIKAGKSGMAHDRTESAYVAAMAHAKSPSHYIAVNSMSGKSRALYLTPYASFAAWQKDQEWVAKNTSLNAELDHANMADGELLDSMDQQIYLYDEDGSYKSRADISQDRYLTINVYHVRTGHEKEWMDVVKLYKAAVDKAGSDAHWAMYDLVFGAEAGTYVTLTGNHSLSDVDGMFAETPKINAALGAEDGEKLSKMFGDAVDTSHHELFSINPRQSYPDEAVVKANPDFWKPKSAPAVAAKPATLAPAKPSSH